MESATRKSWTLLMTTAVLLPRRRSKKLFRTPVTSYEVTGAELEGDPVGRVVIVTIQINGKELRMRVPERAPISWK